jgi:hypothetical protein
MGTSCEVGYLGCGAEILVMDHEFSCYSLGQWSRREASGPPVECGNYLVDRRTSNIGIERVKLTGRLSGVAPLSICNHLIPMALVTLIPDKQEVTKRPC